MAMSRRERITATLKGLPVDRPAVNFYEIGGLRADPSDPDPFNVYNDPSWKPLLELAEEHTDIIRMRSPVRTESHRAWGDPQNRGSARDEFFTTQTFEQDGCRVTRTSVRIAGRILTTTTQRRREVDTVWTSEHLIKSQQDALAYLQLPDEVLVKTVDVGPLLDEERKLTDRGVVMIDTEDPLCAVALLFSMEDFTVFAMTQNALCHRLLEKYARVIHHRTEHVARRLPGRLWRIYGPEFAAEPYLPPRLFDEYVVRYTGPMVRMIKDSGGFARVHVHGRIRNILPSIVAMGAHAIDPVEPPPHGDVELSYVRKEYGKDLVLFGNIEVADIESMEPNAFEQLAQQAVTDGTSGRGRGFVLMPTASPLGRTISTRTMQNYETLVRVVEGF